MCAIVWKETMLVVRSREQGVKLDKIPTKMCSKISLELVLSVELWVFEVVLLTENGDFEKNAF